MNILVFHHLVEMAFLELAVYLSRNLPRSSTLCQVTTGVWNLQLPTRRDFQGEALILFNFYENENPSISQRCQKYSFPMLCRIIFVAALILFYRKLGQTCIALILLGWLAKNHGRLCQKKSKSPKHWISSKEILRPYFLFAAANYAKVLL